MAMAPRASTPQLERVIRHYDAREIRAQRITLEDSKETERKLKEKMAKLQQEMMDHQATMAHLEASLELREREFGDWLGQQPEVSNFVAGKLGNAAPSTLDVLNVCHNELRTRKPQLFKANHEEVLKAFGESGSANGLAPRAAWLLFGSDEKVTQNQMIEWLKSDILPEEHHVRAMFTRLCKGGLTNEGLIQTAELCGYNLELEGAWVGRKIVSLTVRLPKVE